MKPPIWAYHATPPTFGGTIMANKTWIKNQYPIKNQAGKTKKKKIKGGITVRTLASG